VLSAADKRALAARYAEEVLALDQQIGAFFAELKKRGLWDDTLIVVTADHGEELAERGGIEHGHTLHEELLHVPFLWKLPSSWGRARGRSVDALIETRSLLPTLFDLIGQPVAKEVSAPSLLPWLTGHEPDTKPYAWVAAESNGMFSVRTEKLKAIFTAEKNTWQLYDLTNDPNELHDVAATRPRDLAEMQGLLRRWRTGLHPIGATAATLDAETEEKLRSLGYLQ
jgi:arylsulfatase A-like enzyme